MHAGPTVNDAHRRLHAATPREAFDVAIAALRADGLRVTEPRRAVLEVLAASADHLTADQVDALLDGDVHRATVYRTLDLLVGAGAVAQDFTAGGARRFHLVATKPGREHFHGRCSACDGIVVVPEDAFADMASSLRAKTGFVLGAERSILIGVCSACLSRDADSDVQEEMSARS